MTQHYDIVIVGGGMVGTALACALGKTPYSIALIEGKQPDPCWPPDTHDLRVSAITRASECIFRSLGVWQDIVNMGASPFREMFVWDATGKGQIHFDSAEIGEATLGHIIENRVTQLALFQKANSQSNITVLCPEQTKSLRKTPGGYELSLDNNGDISCDLLVAADGAHSWVRQQVGIELSLEDYHQTAVVATVKTGKHHQETAWQRFLPTGPLAFLPLLGGFSSIVWSTSASQAEELLSLDPAQFQTRLSEAFEQKLGPIELQGQRAAFPLKRRHAKNYVLPQLALVGDAAHTIHPLAGQGVNLGLADAATLAQVISQGRTCNDFKSLRRYERWRKGENLAMMTAMSGFKMLFSNDNPVLIGARNLGLNVTDRMGPVKNFFIKHAMGLEGDLPELARCDWNQF